MGKMSIQTMVSNMLDAMPNKCLSCPSLIFCSLNCLDESFSENENENENNDDDCQPF